MSRVLTKRERFHSLLRDRNRRKQLLVVSPRNEMSSNISGDQHGKKLETFPVAGFTDIFDDLLNSPKFSGILGLTEHYVMEYGIEICRGHI